jgi:VWFA-related protein
LTNVTARLAVLASLCGLLAAQSQKNNKTPVGSDDQAPFQLKVASNLVVVRVVVRDAQGKPVEGLKIGDFKLFDRGKEQVIKQFEEENSGAPPASVSERAPGKATATPSSTMPGKFLALYFDDLNASDADMMQARDAADRFLTAKLQPKDRVAIFTSGKMLSDFTADSKQIHDALFQLHVSARALKSVRDCPDLSDYQAQEIAEFGDDAATDAMKVAMDEATGRCHMTQSEAQHAIPLMARSILDQAQIQARTGLQELEQVVKYTSQMPGQRTVILVSPGFLSQSEQYQLDRVIDQALRAQVVISSLDPKGLALLMRETDVTMGYHPSAGSGIIGAMHNVDSRREILATDVLAEVAQGTGGEFFHNNNDLNAGFGALGGSPVYYILAFAPNDAKPDGKFHTLKVTLAEKSHGDSVQARRGYFAAKEGMAEPELEAQQSATSDLEAQAKERLRETVLSKANMQELPVEVRTNVSKGSASTSELAVLAHLDTKSLRFRKDGTRNLNTVTFVSAIFDGSGQYLTGQQRQASVDLSDESLPNLLAKGMDITVTFQLQPGNYTMREVITESEDHHMTALSRSIKIP